MKTNILLFYYNPSELSIFLFCKVKHIWKIILEKFIIRNKPIEHIYESLDKEKDKIKHLNILTRSYLLDTNIFIKDINIHIEDYLVKEYLIPFKNIKSYINIYKELFKTKIKVFFNTLKQFIDGNVYILYFFNHNSDFSNYNYI